MSGCEVMRAVRRERAMGYVSFIQLTNANVFRAKCVWWCTQVMLDLFVVWHIGLICTGESPRICTSICIYAPSVTQGVQVQAKSLCACGASL